MTRYSIGLLVASLGCAILLSRPQSNLGANLTPQLQLTTEVLEARFCESDRLRLQLRLRYLNTGDQPLILHRQSNVIMTYFISKTASDAELEKYEQKYSPLQQPVVPAETLDSDRLDEQKFVILHPAASYEVTSQADLPFIFDGKTEDSDLLHAGNHVLQLRVQTWSAPLGVAVSLRERLRSHGFLWTQSVISRPMTFNIAKHPRVVGCPTELDDE